MARKHTHKPVSVNALVLRARKIKVLLMDVDGVLTDGRVLFCTDQSGRTMEIKAFHAHDGVGLKIANKVGLVTGVISGRKSRALTVRARELGVELVYQNQANKLRAYEEILVKTGATDDEVCYIGDDLPDLPILKRVGLAISVPNAIPEAKKLAHYVTKNFGGNGAVREVVELILKAKGQWETSAPK